MPLESHPACVWEGRCPRRTEALATWPAVATGHRGFGRALLPDPLEGSESLRWARTAGVGGRSPWYQRDRANPSDLKAPHCLWKWFLATLAPRRTPCPVWLGSGLSRPSWVPRHGGDSIRAPRSPGVHISTSRLGLPATVTVRWLPAVGLPSQPRAGVPETRPTVTVSRAEPKLMPTRCPPLPTTHRAPGLAQHSRAYLGDPRGGPGNHCLLTHDVRRTGGPC